MAYLPTHSPTCSLPTTHPCLPLIIKEYSLPACDVICTWQAEVLMTMPVRRRRGLPRLHMYLNIQHVHTAQIE